jgi:hypothetical protein
MKKTSRRSFTKSITAALAVAPFALSANTQGQQRKSGSASPFDNRTHDTPPPIEVIDGSLRTEAHDDHKETHDTVLRRWYYDNEAYPNIAHIKVLHGSGDMIYRNLAADGLIVKISLTGSAGDMTFAGGVLNAQGVRVFRMSSDKKLAHQNTGKNEKRPHKFDHPGAGGDFWVDSIVISDGTNVQFQVQAKTPPEEYRVMIWNEGDRTKSRKES